MNVFIAEKPSVAKAVAEVMGMRSRGEGYYETAWGIVTWAVGHLFRDTQPEEYDPKWAWKQITLEALPIFPATLTRVPQEERKGQLRAIIGLLKRATLVVHAGDPDDEGQAIVDEIIRAAGYRGKVMRYLSSANDEVSVKRALESLKPNSEFEALGRAAVARGQADFIVGMNGTSAYTLAARKAAGPGAPMLPIGRVQTPTAWLVELRERTKENFKPVDFFVPWILAQHPNGQFKAWYVIPESLTKGLDTEGRIVDQRLAQSVAEAVKGAQAAVSEYKAEQKTEAQPIPFSLDTLMLEASRKGGLSVGETNKIAQKLYDSGLTTYPRVDTGYLPVSQHADAPDILAQLAANPVWAGAAKAADPNIKSPAWNDKEVHAHHGIIPTRKPINRAEWDVAHLLVYDIICLRYLQNFYPARSYLAKSASVLVAGRDGARHTFRTAGQMTTNPGWTALSLPATAAKSPKATGEDEEGEAEEGAAEGKERIPDMARGDRVQIPEAGCDKRTTKAPPYFTDATLVREMKSIQKYITDPELKKRLKESDGIGTNATRKSIIENLLKRGILMQKGKHIRSTPVCRTLMDTIDESVRNPGTTALWDRGLSQIRAGQLTPEAFLEKQKAWVLRRIEEAKRADYSKLPTGPRDAKGKPIKPLDGDGTQCPACKVGVLRTFVAKAGPNAGKPFLSCSEYSKTQCSGRAPIEPLPGHGDACPTCGKGILRTVAVKSGPRAGERFLSCSEFTKTNCQGPPREGGNGQPPVEPLPGHGGPCPTCRKGVLRTFVAKTGPRTGERFLSCSEYSKTKCPGPPREAAPGQPAVEPLPGTGDRCSACRKGVLRTSVAKTGPRSGERFLSCSEYSKSGCKGPPRAGGTGTGGASGAPAAPPLPGDGTACPGCKKGRLRTRVASQGPSAGKSFLACDQRPACNYIARGDGKPAGLASGSPARTGARPAA